MTLLPSPKLRASEEASALSSRVDNDQGTYRFVLKRELGAGGMGVVYEAFDRERNVCVALKTLRTVDAQGLERFKNEFRALQGLEHPNVVSLGELVEAQGEWFFTMELIHGKDFLSYVRGSTARGSPKAGADELARLRSALGQLACGLVALHEKHLVHRDIKPSNILVTAEGRTVLMDFGLVTNASATQQSTSAHAIGTASYMAPEQASGAKVSSLSDWYSVGVLLYEALTGRLPFDGSSMNVLMDKLQYDPSPPKALVPDVPADLNDLCMELLRREPERRPSPEEIGRRLGISDLGSIPSLSLESAVSGGSEGVSGSYVIRRKSFVGREEQLAQLRDAYDCTDGKPIVMLIEGESGMGKTTLVERFVESVSMGGADPVVLTGRCYEREQVPYKAFDGVADALCRLLLRMNDDDVAWVMPLFPSLLPLLFPTLKRVGAVARAPLSPLLPDPQAQRTRMFGAFREILQRLAQRRRLIIVLDDLQWTCADSLTLFEEVFGHQDAPAALVLATLRPVDEQKRKRISKTMAMVQRIRSIRVDALPLDQTTELATLLMPGRASSHIRSLVRETAGHPLFLHELARHSQSTELGLSLDAALRARMAELPSAANRLLTVLCIAGGPISQQVASLAASLDGATFTKATSILRSGYLARTDGSRPSDAIAPYHDRVREALLATFDEAERTATHRDLAWALERTDGDARAIVRHAMAAGMPDRAAAHAEQAAQKASASMAFDQAAEFYEIALTVGTQEPQARARLRLARAETLRSAGRSRAAAEEFMLAAEASQHEPSVCVQCRIQAVEQWLISGDLDEGLARGKVLLADIDESIAKTPARALSSLLWNRLRLKLSLKSYPARPEAELAPETIHRLDVLRTMAMGLCATDLVRSADFNARFLLQARRAGEPVRLMQGLGVEASFLSSQGGRAGLRARALLEQMAALAAGQEDPYFAGYLLGIEGIVCMNEGRFAASASSFERAERIYEGLHNRNMLERNAVVMFRMIVLRLGGMHAACRAAIATGLRDAHRRGDTYFETSVCAYRTQDLLASDETEQAREELARAFFTPIDRGFHLQHYFALDARGELALYEGRAAPALAELESCLPHLERSLLLRVRLLRVLYNWLHARLLLSAAASDSDRTTKLKRARRIAQQLATENIGCAKVYALLIHAAHTALKPRRDDGKLIKLLRESIVLAEQHGMASCAAAARFRLGQVVSGNEGSELLAVAHAFCRAEGIVRPESYFELIAPGFDDGNARLKGSASPP